MTAPQPIALDRLAPAVEEGWHVLFDLGETDSENWVLIGGQMIYLLAAENGAEPVRATDDVDVLVDVRANAKATEWLADWLVDKDFELESVSADNIGHRFVRAAEPGPGLVIFDILAPDGIGHRSTTFTRRPARTVEAPGTTQALRRSSLVTVTASGDAGRPARTGRVRRPSVLGALVAKAAATAIAVRTNPDRDWEDAALLLCSLDDPLAAGDECNKTDRRHLRRLAPLAAKNHPAWAPHPAQTAKRGRDALGFLIG